MSLGELLLQARLKQGVSLEKISQAVRVKPEVLAAIETGDTEHVPSVYLKGYIRCYARYLGLPQEIIEKHVRSVREAELLVECVFSVTPPRSPSDRWFKATSYVLASAVVLALVWQFTSEAVRFSQGDPLLRPVQISVSQPGTRPGAAEFSSGPEIEAAKRLPNTHLRASIASMNTDAEFVEVGLPSAAEGAWAAVGNRDVAVSAAGEPGTLEIVTSADSWVEILGSSGEKIEMDLLRAGSHRSYNAAPPLRLLLGRASSVEVFLNGKKIDIAPHTRGNVARFTLSAEESGSETSTDVETDTAITEEPVLDQG